MLQPYTLYFLKVTTRRIIAGKWGCNNGQACISPDYIITTKDFAPKLVWFLIYAPCGPNLLCIFISFLSRSSSSLGGCYES